MAELSQRPSRRRVARRTGPVAAGLAILLVAGGTGWRLTRRPAGHAVAGPGVPTATATVVRTDLKTSTQVSGVLGHAGSYQVIGQGRGGTVTALPAPGQVITRGQAVYEVDGHAGVPQALGDPFGQRRVILDHQHPHVPHCAPGQMTSVQHRA